MNDTPTPMLDDAPTILRSVRALVISVGDQIVQRATELRASQNKTGVDVLTAADQFSEQRLVTTLAQQFPTHRINAEEGSAAGPIDSPWVWHIDPLDGTANFARHNPYWSISAGLAYHHEPVLGVIYQPEMAVLVSAISGGTEPSTLGAWRHDQHGDHRLPNATPAGPMSSWLVATDWPWKLSERQRSLALCGYLAGRVRAIRCQGSAAADLAQVAMGKLDAYAISHIFPWDQCAGAAILRSLGYDLRNWSGGRWNLSFPDIVAMRPGMWPELKPGLC